MNTYEVEVIIRKTVFVSAFDEESAIDEALKNIDDIDVSGELEEIIVTPIEE